MPSIGALHIVQMNLRVPRGNDAYWKLMHQLDAAGPWTIKQIVLQSNVTTRAVSVYVDRLRRGGFVEIVAHGDQHHAGHKPEARYRLVKRPLDAPRLNMAGEELKETQHQLLWRTMKMVKSFTPRELCDLASEGRDPADIGNVRQYVSCLFAAGILGRAAGKMHKEGRYRLIKNLGARAPQILRAKLVFDPNSKAVIGDATATEVSR